MTVPEPVEGPPAGWYPDPGDARQQRWWDSVQWGPQTRGFAPPPPPPSPPPMQATPSMPMRTGLQPYVPAHYSPQEQVVTGATTTRLRQSNRIGYAGAVVGLVSLLLNPVCIPSIIAIVFCIIGLANDEQKRNLGARAAGRGWIMVGLICGIVSTLYTGSRLVILAAHGSP